MHNLLYYTTNYTTITKEFLIKPILKTIFQYLPLEDSSMHTFFNFHDLPDLEHSYEIIRKLGKGTYGEVFEAKAANKTIVVKDVIIDEKNKEFSMKEVNIMMYLKKMKHPNIVTLNNAFKSSGKLGNHERQTRLHMIMDHYPIVLGAFLRELEADFTLPNIKCIMRQLLRAVSHMHEHNIFHRDLKPDNIFITHGGILKVGDFGLSDFFKQNTDGRYAVSSKNVITIWYRPPELLLGETSYGPEVDIWSLGCILAEIFTGQALLKGDDEYKQLTFISTLCGDLKPSIWPGVNNLPSYGYFYEYLKNYNLGKRNVKVRLSRAIVDEPGKDLISQLLVLDPTKRITASEALEHSFFTTSPLPHKTINVSMIQSHKPCEPQPKKRKL